jgi:two-component system, cell cycle response regulator CpdR
MARILVAEDEPSVREFVARALQSFGHEVVSVPDGGAALARLQQDQFDMLLTDIVMPVMDGIALALAATDCAPNMPILMMSGYPSERQRAYNLQDLITEVIGKPFTLAELKAAVNKTLSER